MAHIAIDKLYCIELFWYAVGIYIFRIKIRKSKIVSTFIGHKIKMT